MKIDWWTLGLQAVNVLILVGLLARFLFKPVKEAVAARQAATAALLEEARQARESALAEAATLKAQNGAFAAEAQRQQAQWQAQAQAERERLMAQAREEAGQLRVQQEAAARVQEVHARALLEAQAGELAIRMSAHLLQHTAGTSAITAVNAALSQALLTQVRALDGGQRASLVADQPLRLILARPAEGQAAATLAGQLQEILALDHAPAVEVDASLIAGYELAGAHTRLRSHWRAELDALNASLRGGAHA
jgi:F-type H+-transporting ATPase subunit b